MLPEIKKGRGGHLLLLFLSKIEMGRIQLGIVESCSNLYRAVPLLPFSRLDSALLC